jgi:hypothetical protein
MKPEPLKLDALPLYRCHKEVRAVRIKEIHPLAVPADEAGARIVPDDATIKPFTVSGAYLRKHSPQPGGYFVLYEDGYQSFSPAKAFEEGYTRADG